jgi:membrane fusion protein (multidrug efflux system)
MIKKAGIATLFTFLAMNLTACGVGEAKVADVVEQNSTLPLPVEASLPHRADIFATYQTTGTLESDADAPVLARVSGQVIEVLVEEGRVVEKGQILALLDGDRLRLEMLQAKTNLDKIKREYERLVDLQKRGLVSAAMYEGLKYDMQALQASYKLKRLDYSYTRIRAPISGVISSREIKVGGQVSVNDPMFRITDASTLVAKLKIPQTELAKFSAGQAIRLSVDAMPEIMFAATIDRISPTIDTRNGTFRATAYVANDSSLLAPGMFARFSISYEKHADALVIPAAALIKEDNISVVYVISDGAVVRRVIQTGIESDGMVEVLDGLDIAESVVVTGQSGLRDGSRVLASNVATNQIIG